MDPNYRVLEESLPEESKQVSIRGLQLEESIQELPTHTYSYQFHTNNLYITDLRTGESTVKEVPSFRFKIQCSWCPLPQLSLCFTGGRAWPDPPPTNQVATIDPINCSVATKAPMSTARASHGSVYHRGYAYALGGYTEFTNLLVECERYSVSEDRWTTLPPLPTAVSNCGVVTQEATQSLFVLGGHRCDLIQELSLEKMEWRTLEVKLPSTNSFWLAVFKVSEQECFFVQDSKLYVFSPSEPELRLVKTLSADIQSWYGPSYYSNGTLYCSYFHGAAKNLVIGGLS